MDQKWQEVLLVLTYLDIQTHNSLELQLPHFPILEFSDSLLLQEDCALLKIMKTVMHIAIGILIGQNCY